MRNIFRIFFADLQSIRKNFIAIIIIGGLTFLPSLYAWLNISASWDPYGQTDQLPVGIVNEDKGVILRDEDIDVGKELIDTLKENDSLDWHFVNREKAHEQLEKGDLFAYIVIPENFSEQLGSVIDAHPEKAQVEYYVNEKINAIAPKITEKGASVIVDDISRNFIDEVNDIVFEIFNEIGIELEEELPDIRTFEDYVFELEEKLPEIHDVLETSLADAKRAQEIANDGQDKLSSGQSVVDSGMKTIDGAIQQISDAENFVSDLGPKITQKKIEVENSLSEVSDILDEVENIDFDLSKELKDIEGLQDELDEAIAYVNTVIDALQTVVDDLEETDVSNEEQIEQLQNTIEQLTEIKSVLQSSKDEADNIVNIVETYEEDVKKIVSEMTEITSSVDINIDEFSNVYETDIEPFLIKEIQKARNLLVDAKSVLEEVDKAIPEIDNMLNRTLTTLSDGKELIEEILNEYPYVNDKVTEVANRIRNIQEEVDMNQIIQLLKQDPDSDKSFFSEPVVLHENTVFPVENYGSGMTPFYTVLSLWVGGLLLISILSTNVQYPENFHAREIYYGKWFLFILIGVLQTLIVTLGDVFIIGVEMSNPVWFVFFGFLVSIVFMTLIYTFVSIFGDVGKALAIIMLVLQIAGSGGTYPVALLPRFFQMISPFLPFTYAVGLMREAVGGIVWSNALFDILMLLIFLTIALLIGTFLKEPINRRTQKLMDKSKELSIFQ